MLSLASRSSRPAAALSRVISTAPVSSTPLPSPLPEPDINLPELPSSCSRSWETVYQQEKRVYKQQVGAHFDTQIQLNSTESEQISSHVGF
jgi:hypothetical protein